MPRRKSRYWFKNEKDLMKSLGMKGTPGSGNGVVKEDGQNEHVVAQLKTTEGSSITIKLNDVNTLLRNATIMHKLPIFINQFLMGPVLISVRLEDLIEVAKYIETGKHEKRFQEIVQICEEEVEIELPIVKKGGKAALRERELRKKRWEEKSKRK